MKKAPVQTETKAPDEAYSTSKRGRRAIASLWHASRTVSGTLLTGDDLALIHEALTEIARAVQS
jgi:hypothetical protein